MESSLLLQQRWKMLTISWQRSVWQLAASFPQSKKLSGTGDAQFHEEEIAFSKDAGMASADITSVKSQISIGLSADNAFPTVQLKLLGISSIINNS